MGGQEADLGSAGPELPTPPFKIESNPIHPQESCVFPLFKNGPSKSSILTLFFIIIGT